MPTYEAWKRENWDRAHQEQDITALTGTGLDAHLTTLGAKDLLTPETDLLCIGVGTCYWVEEAVGRARVVWGLDVSPQARERMPEGANFTTDPEDLPSDYFDLALSLWVAPHMTNHDLQEQLCEVIQSLKPGGILAIHYKEPINDHELLDNREGAEDEWRVASSAGMKRRRDYFDQMVCWAGGRVVARPLEMPSYFYNMIEVSAHIQRSV